MFCDCCTGEEQDIADCVEGAPSALALMPTPMTAPVPPAAPVKRTLQLKKDASIEWGHTLGIAVVNTASGLVVAKLNNGIVENHNKTAAPEDRVYPGDRIVACSGAFDPDSMAKRLSEAVEQWTVDQWTVDVESMPSLEVVIPKQEGTQLGFSLSIRASGALAVVWVKAAGLAMEYNNANPDAPIKTGMRIVAVNDIRTTPEMVQEIKEGTTLRFLMREGVPVPPKSQPASPLTSPR
mmetsp:Transcript_151657/g.484778  ORF Transcript_151657/g.484778 Transcript_151657/m.484778 type:complete len:237 (-) Transcript_151657:147-857(-)